MFRLGAKVNLFYFSLFFILVSSLAATTLKFKYIQGKKYIGLKELKSINHSLKVNWNPLLLVLELRHKNHSVRMKADEKFFISQGTQYPLQSPPLNRQGEFYLPEENLEEILTELGLPVHYRIKKEGVLFKNDPPKNTPKSSGGRLEFIMIDPGHGGKDPGAFGQYSAVEKKITLDVSLYLYHYLRKAYPQLHVYITRANDRFIALDKRSEKANQKLRGNNYGLFISLHCNSSLQSKVRGYEIFYLAQNPGSDEDRQVMIRENNNLDAGEADVGKIESFLLNSQILAESKMLARELNRTLLTQMKGVVVSRGVRRADFRVLRKSLMPAVLIEMGYISNSREVKVIQSQQYKERLARAVLDAVKNFIAHHPGLH